MATSIKINGVTLMPIKDAASSISYSRDYVARLAREGKIVASQVGRQWFIDLMSLQTFSEAALENEAVRKEDLRIERKRELHAKAEFITLEKRVREKIVSQRISAAAVTMSALGLGLTVGVTAYTAWLYIPALSEPTNSFASATAPIAETEKALPIATLPHQTMQLTTVMEQPIFADETETRRLAGAEGGIFLLPKSGAVAGEKEVQALFSDPVVVEFSNDNSGVIFYENGDGRVVEYPFVTVPVASSPEALTKPAP